MTDTNTYATQVTAHYLARLAAFQAGGSPVNFLEGKLIVGDGNGSVPALSTLIANGAVVNQVWTGQTISAAYIDPNNSAQLDIQCVIPASINGVEIGPFWVREFAIYDETNQLCVVGTTQLEKTTSAQGQVSDLSWIAAVAAATTGSVVLAAPSAGFATMAQVQSAFNSNLPTCVLPLTHSDTTNSSGWDERVFAINAADQTNLGVGRAATQTEFNAGAPAAGSNTPWPWPTLGQIATALAALAGSVASQITSAIATALAALLDVWFTGAPTGGTAAALTTVLTPVPEVSAATPAACAGLNIRVPVTITNGQNATLTFNVSVNGVAANVTVPLVVNASGSAVAGGEMPGGVSFTADIKIDGTSARLMNSVLSPNYVPLAGGTMTGPLVLSGAPTAALNPATKAYVDGTYSPGGIGYERKSNGKIEQWGFVYFTGGGEGLYGPYTFPIAFPSALDNLSLTTFTPETPSGPAWGDNVVQLPTSNPANATQFWVWNNAIGNGTNNSSGFFWRAIGH